MNFKVFVEVTIYEPNVDSFQTFQQSTFRQSIWFVEESSFKVEVTV